MPETLASLFGSQSPERSEYTISRLVRSPSRAIQVAGHLRRMPFSLNPLQSMENDGTKLPGRSLEEQMISVQNATRKPLIHPSVSTLVPPLFLNLDPYFLQEGTPGQRKKMNSCGARLKNTEINGTQLPTLYKGDPVGLILRFVNVPYTYSQAL